MNEIRFSEMLNALVHGGRYVIYGAGVVAYGVYMAIRGMYGIEPDFFVVTQKSSADCCDNILIYEFCEVYPFMSGMPVLVAAPEIYHASIRDNLHSKRIDHAYYIDAHTEYLLMSRYLRQSKRIALVEDLERTL